MGRGRTVGLLVLCLSLFAVARDAVGAQVRSTQSGTVVLGDGQAVTGLVPLSTTVNTTQAFLVFGVSEDSIDPIDGQITGQLDPSNLYFERIGTLGAVTIKWYVVEFDSGVTVQRGFTNITGNDVTNVLLPAVDLAKSFPLISYRVEGTFFNCNDFVRAKITSTTNLQLSTDNTNCGAAGAVVNWQVVEYADANVRSGDIAFATTDLLQTAALAPPADPAKSWLIYSYEGTPSVSDVGQFLVRGVVTDGSTLTFDRNNSGAAALSLTWYLVEFTDATVVQSGSEPFLTADTQRDVALSPGVSPLRSIAVGGGDYLRGGRSPHPFDDFAGVGWFTFDLTAFQNLRVTRGAGGLAPADVGWSVVTFPALATVVRLLSFDALPSDGAVELTWRTGSELNNLGFHLYRGPSAEGPWTRLTSSLVPGLGFSATGAAYAWRDSGLANGVRYFYRLEDVDSKSGSTWHGPVSAIPQAGGAPPADGGGSASGGGSSSGSGNGSDSSPSASSCPPWARAQLGSSSWSYTCETHGDPFASSFRVVSQSARSAVVELLVPGFLTARDASGHVRVLIPGLDSLEGPRDPALPVKRALLEGVVGKRARIHSVEALDLQSFPGLLPAAVGFPQALVSADGTVRPGRRAATLRPVGLGHLPREQARLSGEGFLGEEKTLTVELMPLRFDVRRGQLLLARRLVVRIEFAGGDSLEKGRGRFGRRARKPRADTQAYAFLGTSAKGLHAATFESLFPGRRRPLDVATLRLTREPDPGSAAGTSRVLVPFHVEPRTGSFGPGSRLFFNADVLAPSMAFSPEVVYALERGTDGVRMGVVRACVDDSAVASSRGLGTWEANRLFAPDILDIEDLWQWESMLGGASQSKAFALDGLDQASPEAARVVVYLQGGSDAEPVVDHHVRVSVNGVVIGEESFDGAVPHRVESEVPVSLLRSDTNELVVLNVGDTGVSSRVFLDRFEVLYPQVGAGRAGAFDGVFSKAGTAEVASLVSPAAVVDVTSGTWLVGYESGGSVRFRAEAHRYRAVSEEALLSPRVFLPEATARLKSPRIQADYVLIAPQAFLGAAQPLLDRRASQGLTTLAASLEQVASSFGGGQPSAEAIRDFLSFAWHGWKRPSPRYVVLLGDANHDPRHFVASSQPSPMPFLLHKTSYIWTVSDPALAAVNGDDLLPDLAIGRLPATTVEQAQAMVGKVLDWEDQGNTLEGRVALVADNPDLAGNFEADARDIESSFLAGRDTTEVFLGPIGNRDVARAQILDAFNQGLSLISYVGHGGGAVWAGENILNSWDAASLQAQPRQPLMLTMNCLNGYFITPYYESLAEAFLKAEGRGTIAAFSPSGLSLDGPAHLFHRAVMQEVTSGRHQRLGDALLAAQKDYATTGAMPELLSVYHLFGDPALKVR